jgi:hypothetical protein
MISKNRSFSGRSRVLGIVAATLAILLASTPVFGQTMASLVSQHGITWYFDQEYQVGRYANGDWWVLGPVTITKITPESRQEGSRWINGTMVNAPQGHSRSQQGYDSSVSMTYVSSLNKAPSVAGPLTLTTGSVLSGVSGSPPNSTGPALDELAVLTVVSTVPPLGAFRPAPYITDKTSYWTESQLDYSILQSLPFVDNMPNIETLTAKMLRLHNEQAGATYQQGGVKSIAAQGTGYGRDTAKELGDMALLLHLAFTNQEKRDLFVGMVQYGLDIYGRISVPQDSFSVTNWWADGGINHGRKWPVLLAGLALGDSEIVEAVKRKVRPESAEMEWSLKGSNRFQEDGSTAYITQAQIDSGIGGYTQDMLGVPEWSARYWQYYEPENDYSTNAVSTWGAAYRNVGSAFVAHALSARLTSGGVDGWGWPAFFDYADRYFEMGGFGNGWEVDEMTPFAISMWAAYRNLNPEGAAISPPKAPVLFVED